MRSVRIPSEPMSSISSFDFTTILGHSERVIQRQPGDIIIDIGEPGDCMYVLKSGEAVVKVGDIIFETVGKGGIVGEMAMLDEHARSASVIARTPCELVAIDRERCLSLVREKPLIAMELMRAIARRLRAMNFYAHHDPVTRLPNRVSLEEHLRGAVSRASRHRNPVAVMTVDIDALRAMDDLLGHAAGDQLLDAAASRLSAALHSADFLARTGGEQFTIVLEDVGEIQNTVSAAQKILADIARPFSLEGHEAALSASIGISCYPQDGTDEKTLLRCANAAVSRAKEHGGGSYQFFSLELNARALEMLAIANKLRLAVERKEFVLHYQPRVDLSTGKVTGVEALIRWSDPERGLVLPSTFIPLAEKRGLITAIGEWVLETACRQAMQWQRAGMLSFRVAVNLSLGQLRQPAVTQRIAAMLRAAGLSASCLELEVTETLAMQDPEATVKVLTELRQMGIALAIDDFGTGYSSLGYLNRFPVDYLKIDRSFICGLPHDSDSVAIARTIIAMAKNLRIRLIAEGVETPEQLAFLKQEGCDEAQGFLFSIPLPEDKLVLRLREMGPA